MNLYRVLELDHTATSDQIKAAYRRLALLHHPDKGGCVQQFQQVSEAYQILSDPVLRQRYDQSQSLPEIELIPPLKIFANAFGQWLSEHPLMAELSELIPIPRYQNKIEAKLMVDLVDMYHGRYIDHLIQLTNEMIQLSSNYHINNHRIPLRLPLTHDQVTIEIELQIQHIRTGRISKKPLIYTLNIEAKSCDNLYRVGDHHLLVETSNPSNIQVFDQHFAIRAESGPGLYRIGGMGLPGAGDRGYLYLLVLTPSAPSTPSELCELPIREAERCDLREILRN